ncbi:hypothetical protein KUCAC02_030347 [Chaenocephalus aceratus]|uniref:Uncharacterized protein n=1 Tax=Chaenocephalus aceratus TaxID=36190 RepID=A0ACB9XJR9_CHAAC|nr:hypothetical protein KUCAC02_030347 [Chaenocephalus aceratus]
MLTLRFGQHLIKASAVFLQTELSFAMVNRKPVVPGQLHFEQAEMDIPSIRLTRVIPAVHAVSSGLSWARQHEGSGDSTLIHDWNQNAVTAAYRMSTHISCRYGIHRWREITAWSPLIEVSLHEREAAQHRVCFLCTPEGHTETTGLTVEYLW